MWTGFMIAALGGALIGLAGAFLLAANGRIAGISGIAGGLATAPREDRGWRLAFLAGMVLMGVVLLFVMPGQFDAQFPVSGPLVVVGGLLVGFGTRLGNGCTSGHGICGVSRFSLRSIAATMTFMAAGMFTVLLVKGL